MIKKSFTKLTKISLVLALIFPSAFMPMTAFATTFTYDGVTYPGNTGPNEGTYINDLNTDVVGNVLDGNILMTGDGSLILVNSVSVNGTINSDVSGEGYITFLNGFEMTHDIGVTNSFRNISLAGSGVNVDLNGHGLRATRINVANANLYLNGGAVVGDVTLDYGSVRISQGSTIDGVVRGNNDARGDVMVLEGEADFGDNGIYDAQDTYTMQNNFGVVNNSLSAIYIGENKHLSAETHDVYSQVIKLNQGSTFSVGSGTIRGAIVGNSNGQGILNVTSQFATSSNIGSGGGGGSLNKITIAGTDAKLTINNNIAANEIVSEGIVDFSSTAHTINANFLGMTGSSITDANSGHHTINGLLEIRPTAIIASKLYDSGSGVDLGSITSTGVALIGQGEGAGEGAKLRLNISELTLSRITAGTSTFDLIIGGEESEIFKIQDVDISLGGVYGSNSVGALTFHTYVDGDNLKLSFTTNSSIFEVADDDSVTRVADISQAAVIVGESAALNMGVHGTNANITLKSGAHLTVNGSSIGGFITGLSDGAGSLNIATDSNFSSNYDVGYLHSLQEIKVQSEATVDVFSNWTATSLILEDQAALTLRGGNIATNNIELGDDSSMNILSGLVSGTIDGIATGQGSLVIGQDGEPLVNFVTNNNIGSTNKLEQITIASGSTLNTRTNNNSIAATSIDIAVSSTITAGSGNIAATTTNLNGTLTLGSGDVTSTNIFMGSGSVLNTGTGDINGNIGANEQGEVRGSVNVLSTFYTNGNFGDESRGLAAVNIAQGVGLFVSNDDSLVASTTTLNNNSTLTLGSGGVVGNVYSDVSGHGTVLFYSNLITSANFGGTGEVALDQVIINSGAELTANGNINATNIDVSGVLNTNHDISGEDFVIYGNLNLGDETRSINVSNTTVSSNLGPGSINAGSGDHVFDGTFTADAGTVLGFKFTQDGVGSISSSGLSTINSGVSLNLDVSAYTEVINADYNIVLGGVGSTINTISDADINVGGSGFNRSGIYRFSTSAVDNNLVLNVTVLQAALNIAAADGSTYDYSQGNPNENNTTTSINDYATINLIDSGATLTMGSGDIGADINIDAGAILNTGTGNVNGAIAARTANSQGTVNVVENLTVKGDIGAEDRAINVVNVLAERTLDIGDYNLIATTVNIGDNAALNVGGQNADGFIAANTAGTSNAAINIGAGGLLEIGYVADDSINANVNGSSAGSGNVIIDENVTLSNLLIGNNNRINQLRVYDADVALGANVSANEVEIEDAELVMLDGTVTTVTDRLFINSDSDSTYFYLGEEEGDGATLNGKVEIQGSDGADMYVNKDSTINGDVEFIEDDGYVYLYKDSTVNGGISGIIGTDTTYDGEGNVLTQGIEGSDGEVYIRGNGVSVTGDISNIYNLTIDRHYFEDGFLIDEDDEVLGSNFDAGSIDISVTNEIRLEEKSSLTTAGNISTEFLNLGDEAELRVGTGSLVAQNIHLSESAFIATSGMISAGIDGDSNIVNSEIGLVNNSILYMNEGSSLYANIYNNDYGDGTHGNGEISFGDRLAYEEITINGNIGYSSGGDLNRIAAIRVGENVGLSDNGYYIYVDNIVIANDANFVGTGSNLYSSIVTVDTNDAQKGITAEEGEAVRLTTLLDSSLTIASGIVTSGYEGNTLELNTDEGSTTIITVGRDVATEGNVLSTLSNTNATNGNVIRENVDSNIALTINNLRSGVISSVSGDVIDVDIEDIEASGSTLILTNAGSITASSERNAISSGFASNITNSSTGTITGKILLNSALTNIVNNSGTINGDIEIGTGDSSAIAFNDGGRVNGDLILASSGQYVDFNEGTLNGDIYGTSGIKGNVIIHNATFIKGTTQIEASTFTTAANSNLYLTLSSSSITPLEVVGAASIASSTTLNLSITGSIAVGERYKVINATEMTNSGNIVNSYIKINNLANRYDGKAFTSLFEDNALWLVAGSESEATIITPDEKIRETFNQILAISNPGNKLQAIQDILNNSTDDAQKEEIVKSVLPQVDNGVNRGTFNIATSSVNVATGRVDTLRNGKSSGDETPTKRIWGESFASSANQESTATSSGYKLNGHGFAIGGDQEIDHDQYIGGNISYANTTIKTQGSPKNTVASTYQINAYASRNFERFFLDGVAGFAWNEYTSTRTISAANTNAVGRYSGQAFISKIRTGSVFNLENSFIFTPELTITAARNKVDAYTEEGAEDLNLHVHSTSSNFLEGRVGFSLSHNDSLFGNVFIPQIRLSYGYDFIGSRQESTSNFVGQSTTFQSQGAKIVKGSTKIGGGLKLYTKGAIALSADYDLEIKAKYKAHAATARFTYAF